MTAPRLIAVVIGLVLAFVTSLPAAPQQAPVFRSDITVVPLTVTVLDKSGRPVTDLKQSDFSVFENDQFRNILTFFPEPLSARPVTPMRSVSQTPWSANIAPKTSRTFLFVLGLGRIQYPTRAIDGLQQFIREKLLPQDAIAVLGFNRATAFTTDHEQILRMLERYKREHEPLVFEINEFRLRNRRHSPHPPSFQAAIDAIFSGPGGDSFRRATSLLLGLDRPSNVRDQRPDLQVDLRDVEWSSTDKGIGISDLIVENEALKIFAGIEYLRDMDGEKHLVFLGHGIELVAKEDERRMARRAADARVTLDVIGTSGVLGSGLAGLSRIQGMQNVSALTGGRFTGVSMAEKALDAIDRASRFSYLLGYQPVKAELDGAFREVRVKVNRPNVTVLFRHGYFAAEQPDPTDVNDAIAQARVESAIRIGEASTDIALTANALLIRSAPPQHVVVDLVIDASRIIFKPVGDDLTTFNLVLGVFIRDVKGRLVGQVIGRLTAEIDQQMHRDLLAKGIPYSIKMPVNDIPYDLKIVTSDYGSALVGTAEVRVRSK